MNRFLRRLTVSRRVLGGFLGLALLLALTIPVMVADHSLLTNRLRQATDVEANADRLLLQAAVRVEASRVNLSRYIQDYLPSSAAAIEDSIAATELLADTHKLITSSEQKEKVDSVVTALGEYQTLLRNVQAARLKGDQPETSRLVFLAYKTGADIDQQIAQIVEVSKKQITDSNQAAQAEAQARLTFLIGGIGIALALALFLGIVVAQSITRPIDELRAGAEAFSQGRLDTTLSIAGADELSLLARTFNQMAVQLSKSYQELEQRVAERTAELERRSNYLAASAEIGRATTSILETEQLIRPAVELIRERFDLYYVGLFQVDEAGEWAVLKAGTGEAGRAMVARDHRLKIGSSSMIGWCIANAKARAAAQVGDDAIRLVPPELPETRSEAALPLRSRGKVIGALSVQSTHPGIFDTAAISVLQTVADQVGVAIDNARLFAESQAALDAARRAYGELSRQGWAQLIRSRQMGYRRTAQGIQPATGEWQPEMAQATQTGQLIHDHGATIAVPIKVRDQVLGVMRLRKPDSAQGWTSEETALLGTLTEQLGVALESARLYQDTQRRAAQEQLTSQVTGRMRESLDVETVLKTAATEMRQALGLDKLIVRLGTHEEKKPLQAARRPIAGGREK
jgi:GAF domain-containing protein/HAMP domain-containing protein